MFSEIISKRENYNENPPILAKIIIEYVHRNILLSRVSNKT